MLNFPSLPDKAKLYWLTLSFGKDLEKTFRNYYFQDSLQHVRIALAVGLFFYGIFGVLDAWLVPEAKHKLWFIRYAIIFPYVLSVYLFSFTRLFKKYMQLSIASALLIAPSPSASPRSMMRAASLFLAWVRLIWRPAP